MTYAAAAVALGGRRTSALAQLHAAVSAGLVHESQTQVPTKGNALRSALGLFPGPAAAAVLPDEPMDARALRELRASTRVTQSNVARQLGVSRGLVHRWENDLQPIPTWAASHALIGALEDAQTPQRPSRRRDSKRQRELLAQVRATPGISWHQLVGRSVRDRRLVESARRAGHLHEGPAWTKGTRQPVTGLFAGRRPQLEVAAVLMADLKRARLEAGWSHAAMAQHLSDADPADSARVTVAATTYAGWERTLLQVPGWAAAQASHALSQARSKRRDAAAEDDQQRAAIVAAVTGQPGLSRKALLPRVQASRPYQVESVLAQLLAENVLHERHAGRHGQQTGLYPGPSLGEVLTPEQLVALRTRAGLTQRRLAELVGYDVQGVRYWEDSTRPMSLEWQQKLRTYLEGCPDVPAAERDHLEQQLLNALRERPRTRRQLHLLKFGFGSATDAALAGLVARGALVEDRVEVLDTDGVTFRRKGFRVPA